MVVYIWFLFYIMCSLLISKSSSLKSFGCYFEYHPENCVHNITCVESTQLSSPYHLIDNEYYCDNFVSSNGNYYVPVHIVYRRMSMYDINEDAYNIIWGNDNYPISDLIVDLDISNNEFKLHPILSSMPNLKLLNISHNELTTAMLSNTIEFNNLVQIDFSFNRIMDIVVDSGEYIYSNLSKLDLSHNALHIIPEAIFSSFTALEVLNLSHNRITALNVLDFEGIRKLRILKLDYNELFDINSSLLRFRELQELSLRGNKLTRLLKSDFENLIKLHNLDLSSNNIVSVEMNAFDNMTSLININLSRNALNVIDKETFNCLLNLEIIDLSSNNLKYLPINMFVSRKISFFSVEDNVLVGELVTGTFKGLNAVITLNISNQYLTSIADDAFNGLGELKILFLYNNKINFISRDSFRSLYNLKELDLSNNFMVNIDFDKTAIPQLRYLSLKGNVINNLQQEDFSSLKNLQSCDLSNNNITYIKNNTFKDLVMLHNLQISHNPLSVIETSTFIGLAKLPTIDISFSKVSLLKNNTFQHLKLLIYINVSHSDIAELQYNTFSDIQNVLTIDLSHNKLTNFDVNTTDLGSLRSLMLNNNYLTDISYTSFKKLMSLLNVNLSYNNLNKIHNDAFAGQKSLRELDLSYNPLLVFSPDFSLNNLRTLNISGDCSNISFFNINGSRLMHLVFSHAKLQNITSISFKKIQNLTYLVLSNNEIESVNKDAFIQVELLQYLDLSYNNIRYIQPGAFKNNRDLKTLNVSHNFLTSINYGTLRGLIGLNLLDLSFNYIDGLEREKFIEVENLEILIVDNNYIQGINYTEFQDSSLLILSIGDNPIPCKQIYDLKQEVNINITALIMDVHHENIDGITCNIHYSPPKEKQTINDNEQPDKVVNLLKELLSNASTNCKKCHNNSTINNNSENQEFYTNISQSIQKSSTDVLKEFSQLNDAASSINSLLERLLKVMVTMNNAIRRPLTELKDNGTSNNVTLYLNKIKQDLEDNIIVQKESILAEVDDKINLAIARKRPIQEKVKADERKPAERNVTFIEISLTIILTILVGLLICLAYKCYKGSSSWTRITTVGSRENNDMENSNL